MNTLSYLADRLREPSSWAGLAGILAAVGVSVSPDIWREATAAATGLAGLAAVLMRERQR
jgi:hypothetical protein